MAIDRTLDLRPGVLDIADNVDDILTILTPTILNANDVTFSSDFEQYSSSAANRVNIVKIAGMVFLSGAVKPKVEIPTGEHVIFTLPNSCKPTTDKYFVCQGSQSNKYTLRIHSDTGEVTMSRYGTVSYLVCPVGAFLRIESAYTIY